jgi:hypothetical protein
MALTRAFAVSAALVLSRLDQIRNSEMAWTWSQLCLVHLGRRVPGSRADESYGIVEQISWDSYLMLGSVADVRSPAGAAARFAPEVTKSDYRSAATGVAPDTDRRIGAPFQGGGTWRGSGVMCGCSTRHRGTMVGSVR